MTSAYRTRRGYYAERLDDEPRPVKRVQPFPVIQLDREELVVPPREYGTLVESPEPRRLEVA